MHPEIAVLKAPVVPCKKMLTVHFLNSERVARKAAPTRSKPVPSSVRFKKCCKISESFAVPLSFGLGKS